MFSVVKTGGKQYRVSKNDIVIVEKIAGEAGDVVSLDEVLMIGKEGEAPIVGTPRVEKAAVFAEVVEQGKADKVIIFKKKRRQNYRRKNGHRQEQTVLRVVEVSPTGTKPKGVANAKAAPAAEVTDKPAEVKKAPAKKATPKKEAVAKEAAAKDAGAEKTPVKKKNSSQEGCSKENNQED